MGEAALQVSSSPPCRWPLTSRCSSACDDRHCTRRLPHLRLSQHTKREERGDSSPMVAVVLVCS